MRDRITALMGKLIEQWVSEGVSQPEVARRLTTKFRLSPPLRASSVSRHLKKKGEQASTVVVPAATIAELGRMAPADRLEAQLATLDQVLVGPNVTPAVRARLLTTYSNLLERSGKMRARDSRGERQFDGLADLLLSAAHAESSRWSSAPADWLEDAVPRVLPTLHEIAGALERVPADSRKATSDRLRQVLHRILGFFDA